MGRLSKAGDPGSTPAGGGPSVSRALAAYTGLRAVLFVLAYAVLLIVGVRGLVAIAAALLLSALASPFLLRRQREAVATALAARQERRRAEQERLRGLLDG